MDQPIPDNHADKRPPSAAPTGESSLETLLARMRLGDRAAAATFMEQYGPYIQRRLRGKLGKNVRRLCDTTDLLSTVCRRLDLYVSRHRISATEVPQLFNLINQIAETAVIDKLRALERLQRAEKEDAEVASLVMERARRSGDLPENELASALETAIADLPARDDRDIVILWSHDMPLFRIAEQLGRTPAAIRQRWAAIRQRLRHSLEDDLHAGDSR